MDRIIERITILMSDSRTTSRMVISNRNSQTIQTPNGCKVGSTIEIRRREQTFCDYRKRHRLIRIKKLKTFPNGIRQHRQTQINKTMRLRIHNSSNSKRNRNRLNVIIDKIIKIRIDD